MTFESLELMRMLAVCKATGLSRPYVYLLERRGQFPSRVKIGRASAWVRTEVEAFIRERMSQRQGGLK